MPWTLPPPCVAVPTVSLHSDLGPDALTVQSVRFSECLGPSVVPWPSASPGPRPTSGFLLEVQARCRRPDVSLTTLIGHTARLDWVTTPGHSRSIHGHVTSVAQRRTEGGAVHCHLRIEPWTAFLAQGCDSWVFQNQSVIEITESVLSDHLGRARLTPRWRLAVQGNRAQTPMPLCVQGEESDLAFLHRLWAQAGIWVWFEHGMHGDTPTAWGHHTLVLADHPGALASQGDTPWVLGCNHAEGADERLSRWQRWQAVGLPKDAAWSVHTEGRGNLRSLSAGSHLALADGPSASRWGVWSAVHRFQVTPTAPEGDALSAPAVHEVDFCAAPLENFFPSHARPCDAGHPGAPLPDGPPPGRLRGLQTALVVGWDTPLHSDPIGRVTVQCHWQRGSHSSHRLSPAHTVHASPHEPDNAQAQSPTGVWARVAQHNATPHGGHAFMPRLGQEVLVASIARSGACDTDAQEEWVLLGGVYNGQGLANAQGNAIGKGAAHATGNAPPWFAGSQRHGRHPGHAHPASLSGIRSHSLSGQAHGHNQWVFDDTPEQGRIWAHSTQDQTWLQMGHLLQQHGNQRLAPWGEGMALRTLGQGHILAGTALRCHSGTETPSPPTERPHAQGDITLSAQGELSACTPEHFQWRTEADATVVATHDLHSLAQGHHRVSAQTGIHLQGDGAPRSPSALTPKLPEDPSTLLLHAQHGSVRLSAHDGPAELSTQGTVSWLSHQGHVHLRTGGALHLSVGGSHLHMEGSHIHLRTPGGLRMQASLSTWEAPEGVTKPSSPPPI